MKFTPSLLDAVFCCLLTTLISSATAGPNNPQWPKCDSNGVKGCPCDEQMFTCDPFGPQTCGSMYMEPDQPQVNVPVEVSKDLFLITRALYDGVDGNPFNLIALPFKLVNNGNPGDYEVNDAFVDAMKTNVQNYVAQDVSKMEMTDLYNGISGNNAEFKSIAVHYDTWDLTMNNSSKTRKDRKETKDQLDGAIQDQQDNMVQNYPMYKSSDPWNNPAINKISDSGGTTVTGPNGYGIYYSAFVAQMLIAFMQQIAVDGLDAATSRSAQVFVVDYGWKGIKHAEKLIKEYVAQREGDITGPNTRHDNSDGQTYYEVQDDWAYYQGVSAKAESCSWKESNLATYYGSGKSYWKSCDKSTRDFVNMYSSHCVMGRKQFVVGPLIANWNTWLIEPSKQWAKLVDLICERANRDDEKLQMLCNNQGNSTESYNSKGGTAIDYINNKEAIDGSYVLGPKNTNDCPEGSSHVITRDQCQTAYNQLVKTNTGINNGVDYDYNWGTTRPSGCFLFLTTNTVNFNPDTNNNSGNSGDTLGGDQPICFSPHDKYIIQQTCQHNYPGQNVIATPVQCVANGCTNYYKSIQPDADSKTPFLDQCDAGVDGWTCCLEGVKSGVNGHACSDGNNNECNNGLVCGRYDNSGGGSNNLPTNYQCCHCTDNDCVIQGETWCRNEEGGLCSDGNDNNCAAGLVCGRTSENPQYPSYTCCEDYYYPPHGSLTCKQNSQQYEVTTNMLVGSSNEIRQESNNMPPWAMVGILGLAMVATYKLAKPRQDKYNELE